MKRASSPTPTPPRLTIAVAGEQALRGATPSSPSSTVAPPPTPIPNPRQVTGKGKEPRPYRKQTLPRGTTQARASARRTDLGCGSGRGRRLRVQQSRCPARLSVSSPGSSRHSRLGYHLLPTRPRMMAEEEDFESRQFLSLVLICSRPRRLPLPLRAWPLGYGSLVRPRKARRSATSNYNSHETPRPERFRELLLRPLFSPSGSFSARPQGGVQPRAPQRTTIPIMPCGQASQPFRKGARSQNLIDKGWRCSRHAGRSVQREIGVHSLR